MQRLLVCILAITALTNSAFAADEPEELLLKTAGLPTEPSALLDFLKQRSRELITEGELDPFLKKLGSTDAKEASWASTALVIRGPLAIPALRRAINDLSAKTAAERAKKCLSQIEGRAGADLVAATTRLIGTKNPPQAVEVLLAYLPYADDAIVLEAIGTSLSTLAYPDGKVHPALLKAIDHDVPLVRATAIEALSSVDHPETRPAIAKKLADPSIPVRKRAALALAKVDDLTALTVLVELLAELTKTERAPVEEMLRSFAGETVPKNLPTGDDAKDRKSLRDAWAEWWQKIESPSLLGRSTPRNEQKWPSVSSNSAMAIIGYGKRHRRSWYKPGQKSWPICEWHLKTRTENGPAVPQTALQRLTQAIRNTCQVAFRVFSHCGVPLVRPRPCWAIYPSRTTMIE